MSSEKLMEGQWALVTGASRGVGAAIAERFAQEGANLCLAARTTEKLEQVADSCRKHGAKEVEIYSVDLTSSKDIDQLCKDMLSKHKIDVLVNNAGMATFNEAPYESDADGMEKMIQLNLNTPMRLCHHLSKPMVEAKKGVIIDIASIAGVDAVSSQAAYSASKWGLHGWSESASGALRDKGVKVCCIAPGYIDTEMPPEDMNHASMIKASDIAEICTMPFKLSIGCIPQLIVLRNAEILD